MCERADRAAGRDLDDRGAGSPSIATVVEIADEDVALNQRSRCEARGQRHKGLRRQLAGTVEATTEDCAWAESVAAATRDAAQAKLVSFANVMGFLLCDFHATVPRDEVQGWHGSRGREESRLRVPEECAAVVRQNCKCDVRRLSLLEHELCNLFAQFAAKDLAGRGLRNSIDKANLARLFVVCETIGNE